MLINAEKKSNHSKAHGTLYEHRHTHHRAHKQGFWSIASASVFHDSINTSMEHIKCISFLSLAMDFLRGSL